MQPNIVFLSELPQYTNKKMLERAMKKFGKLKFARIFSVESKNGEQKVYAKIKFKTMEAAQEAVRSAKVTFGTPNPQEIKISWVRRKKLRNQASKISKEPKSTTNENQLKFSPDNKASGDAREAKSQSLSQGLTFKEMDDLRTEFKKYKKMNFQGVTKLTRLIFKDDQERKILQNHYSQNLEMKPVRARRTFQMPLKINHKW